MNNFTRAIGLMSGTSLDGIDAACIAIRGELPDVEIELLQFITVPFEPALRTRIAALCENGHVEDLARVNFELGEAFAQAALEVLCASNLSARDVEVIGSHGQTVSHLPAHGVTLQIGEAAIIAERTGITTVCDFRPRDMAAGGQGAPLVPFADWLLLRHPDKSRIVQNIGGIANLTWLPHNGTLDDVRAWDTGPGNMVIDECVKMVTSGTKYFDEDGALAAQGKADDKWLRHLMQHPFFVAAPPKSAGREEFGRNFAVQFYQEGLRRGLPPHDIIATATALTAYSIVDAYKVLWREVPQENCEVVLCGGGAYNKTLRSMIAELCAPASVITLEEIGGRSDAKEAIIFALLAHATLHNHPNNVPGATGAKRAVVLGKIVPA